jgi:integral membrane protein
MQHQSNCKDFLIMDKYFKTTIGRLRLFSFLEGTSLLILVLIAVPLKYYFGNPSMVKAIGPIHGALFLLFVFYALNVGIQRGWKFKEIALIICVSSFIPFGNFYVDHKILGNRQTGEQ